MANVRLLVAYRGTAYHGWAHQPEVPTVEGHLREAVSTFLNTSQDNFFFQGASRTDAGVHAQSQTVNIRHDVANRSMKGFVRGLNTLTPEDITVCRAEEVDDDFHARHNARGKLYRYQIWNHRFKHPMLLDRAWHMPRAVDIDAMRRAGALMLGAHDFVGFRASDCQSPTTIRNMSRIDVEQDGPVITIWVEGSAFLKYMVRIIAGTLIKVGMGQADPSIVEEIFETGQRKLGGVTAPPQGLTLMKIYYPNHPWSEPEPFLGGQPLSDAFLKTL